MPRVTKKERRLDKCQRMGVNDITLSDFANASMTNPSAHIRKGAMSVHLDSKNIGKVSNLGKEDLSWFEKDLDDFEIDVVQGEQEGQGEQEENENVVKKPSTPTKRRVKKGRPLQVTSKGRQYPDDLWYQLSHYIHPESVLTFSRLCRSAYRIVNSVAFWKHLYYRFYHKEAELPKSLNPVFLERLHGLKPYVVRSLYYTYSPFVKSLTPTATFEAEPHKLVGRKCLLSWYQPVKNNLWNFCFKLMKAGRRVTTSQGLSRRDFLDQYDDIMFNTEDGCTVLQVTCTHFLSMPIIMGQVLNKVTMTISGQMRYHTLRLMFDTRYQHERNVTGTSVTLDSVVNVRVIPWWDPKYPFNA